MRFRRRAKLDTGQVTDVRGRRMGGGLAVGGGGLGLAGLVVVLLFTLLSGGEGGLGGQLGPLEDQQVGQGDTPGEVSTACQTGEDANTRQDCRIGELAVSARLTSSREVEEDEESVGDDSQDRAERAPPPRRSVKIRTWTRRSLSP